MARNIKKEVKKHKEISYTNRDFDSFKNELNRYISTHFNENIVDTTDAGLAGMLVDLAAYVGDVMSYYIDHQFNESSIETAVEEENIERFIRDAGVEIAGPSPSIAEVTFRIRSPSTQKDGQYLPNSLYLPTIKRGTIVASSNGIEFTLLDDVNFAEKNSKGKLVASYKIGQLSGTTPLNFILELKGVCTSAKIATDTLVIGNDFVPFRVYSLIEPDVSEIVSVYDSNGDRYYEVESLTQDTVFKRSANSRKDAEYSPERLHIFHAPKRYVKHRSSVTGLTSIRFGSGDETKFDEDIIPDPSEHAVTLYGDRPSTKKITIDPNSFLETQTLGISPRNTTLTITYRHGGGLGHNVGAGLINSVKSLITKFSTATPTSVASSTRASTSVFNNFAAAGGEDEPTLEELRSVALLNKNSQNRIVTREDLLARVYSLPTNFGRVFRASVRDNPNNPQAAQLHIISRDSSSKLILSPDTLKENLGKYLSKFRIVSDAIDILDASIVNICIDFSITVESNMNADSVVNIAISKINDYFNIRNWQIDQPIIIGEIENLILNTTGVVNIIQLTFSGKSGIVNGLRYADTAYEVKRHIDRGYIFPPRGGIFELKYPGEDIIGRIS